jgi:hypothetical protein
MGLISALIENCFDGMSLDGYKGSLQLRDALIELSEKHGYRIVTYRGREHDIRRGEGLTHNDDIDNAKSIEQEVNAARNIKTIHIIYGYIDGPYCKALQSGEILESECKKYFNFIWTTTPSSRTTAFEHLKDLLGAEKRMLYEQKDEY